MAETAADALGGVGVELLNPLERAAGKGDAQATSALLASGADVSIDDNDAEGRPLHRTVLHWASFGGNPDVVKAVLQFIASNDVPAAYEEPSAVKSVENVITAALAARCLSTLGGPDGTTALHLAAEGGHVAAVVVLLEAGADDAVRDGNQRTPMSLAVAGAHDELVLELLRRGRAPVDTPLFADANIAFENGPLHGTLLHWASFGGDPDMVNAVLNAVVLTDSSYYGELPSYSDVFDALARPCWRKGGGPDGTDIVGTTALHLATEAGHAKAVSALLSAGARPHMRDWNKYCAFENAVCDNNVEALSLFLEAGVDPNHRRPLNPPLSDLPSDATFVQTATFFNGREKYGGASLLHLAAQHLSDGAVELLLAAGAREDIPAFEDGKGEDSLEIATLSADVIGFGLPKSTPVLQRHAHAIRVMLAGAHLFRKGWLSVLRARFDAGERLTGLDSEGKGGDETGDPTPRRQKVDAAAAQAGPAGTGKRSDADVAAVEDEAWYGAAVWIASVPGPEVFRIITEYL